MKLPPRVVFSLLAFITVTSIVVRFPQSPHEIGVDSFINHNLSANLVVQGNAPWLMNPLSWFGWYPLSYPAGDLFLFGMFSSVGGVSVETSILLVAMMYGILSVSTSFIMAREFRNDDFFCIGVSFLYALAPRLLTFTLWTASTRGLFMALMPMFVWVVLRTYKRRDFANLFLAILIPFLLAVAHRLAALLVVFAVAFLAAAVVSVAVRVLLRSYPRTVLSHRFQRSTPYLTLAAFGTVTGVVLLGTNVLDQYSVGELGSGSAVSVQLLNLGVSLARSVGFGLILAAAGVVTLVRLRNKSLSDFFLLMVFVGLTPTLFLRLYTGFYILPIIALFGGLSLSGLSKIRRKFTRRAAVASCFVIALVFSTGVLQYEISQTPTMPGSRYSTALYVMQNAEGEPVIANDGLLGVQVACIAQVPYLPVGGAGIADESPELLMYGFFSPGFVLSNTRPIAFGNLTLDPGAFFDAPGVQAGADWVRILTSPYNARSAVLARYHPVYFLENISLGASFAATSGTYPSQFASTAYANTYKIYDDGSEALWFIESG